MNPSVNESLGLVVPVFEEQERVPDFGHLLVDYITGQPAGSELVFVDDGSSDHTCELIQDLIAERDAAASVRLLRRPHLGKGAAVAAGLASVRTTHAAFCDLDLSTPLVELDRVIDVARRAEVLALGSRDLSGSTLLQRESRFRETLGRSYNRLLQATVTPGVVDTQCGAKAASTDVWAAILPFCRQRGFAWDAEVVAVAQSLGLGVQEVPIAWCHDERTKVRVGRDGVAMVLETPRIWASARRAGRSPRALATNATASRRQWWFRGKAAYVSTALRRTGGASDGLLVDAGASGVASRVGWDLGRLVLVEPSLREANQARAGQGLAAVQGSVPPLPIADRSAAVVLVIDVLEHLDDADAALADFSRVLAPGGRLVITVDAAGRFSSGLEHLLETAGFEIALTTHVFSWLVMPVWIERKLFGHRRLALGLGPTSTVIDRVALALTALERFAIGRVRVPVGTSLLIVARSPSALT